jgi:Clp amino terminal domain, pathogenicity island component
MAWALSRSVYHGIGAATANARSCSYPHVSGAHLIAAFLEDPQSMVARADRTTTIGQTIRDALAKAAPARLNWPTGPAPVGLAPEVEVAILDTDEADAGIATTGHVLLRLLTGPHSVTTRQLARMGVDPTELTATIADLLSRGEQDQA